MVPLTQRTRSLGANHWHHHQSRGPEIGQPDRPDLCVSAVGRRRPGAHADVEQRFEVDGADHARKFLLDRGFSTAAVETVWTAIALHTTPGIPGRMAPEIATTHLGVLTDVIGFSLEGLEHAQMGEILAVHPRGDFKNEFLRACLDGLKHRPETTI